jgi:acetyltransferase-like isoleucine patch superfamily enzyme
LGDELKMNQEFRYEPFQLNVAPTATLGERLKMFLGHYDLRIYVNEKQFIDVGRGSFDAALKVILLGPHQNHGLIGSVGQFCDFAETVKLFGGGAHQNNLPVNVMMTNIPIYRSAILEQQLSKLLEAEHKPFKIGNGVVLSENVSVLAGCDIGNGVIVGAGAIVVGRVESFGICAGVPAQRLRERFDNQMQEKLSAVRWWDFDIVYLGNNLRSLQSIAIDTNKKHVYRKKTPSLIVKLLLSAGKPPSASIDSFLENDQVRSINYAPKKMQNYVRQLGSQGPYYWLADAWN